MVFFPLMVEKYGRPVGCFRRYWANNAARFDNVDAYYIPLQTVRQEGIVSCRTVAPACRA